MKNEQQKGIWIPTEILQDNRLDLTEKVILAIYKYYTVDGDAHCCYLTNDKLTEMIGVSKRTIQRIKQKLKELNLIDTDGGIRAWYTGGDKLTQGGDKLTPQGRQNDTPGGDKMTPKIKNKIKKNKKENKDTYNISDSKGNDDIESSEKLTTDKSATCSDIAIAYEKEKEKENNKHTYNLSTLVDKSTTSDISTSKGDKNRPDWALDDDDMVTPKPTVADIYGLEFSNLIHQYWIDNDSLPLCDYYRQHPTDDISTAIKKALNSSDLQGFENFKNSLNNTNIKSLHY